MTQNCGKKQFRTQGNIVDVMCAQNPGRYIVRNVYDIIKRSKNLLIMKTIKERAITYGLQKYEEGSVNWSKRQLEYQSIAYEQLKVDIKVAQDAVCKVCPNRLNKCIWMETHSSCPVKRTIKKEMKQQWT